MKTRKVRAKASSHKGLCRDHEAFITSRLETSPSADRTHRELRDGFALEASYQYVNRFVTQIRQSQPQRVYQLKSAPEEAQFDFGQGPIVKDDQGGKMPHPHRARRAELSFSRKGYSEAVLSQNTETFLRCLENAFRHFGGVPKVLNLANLKAAVLHTDWFDPDINPNFEAFCRHYGTTVMPCRLRELGAKPHTQTRPHRPAGPHRPLEKTPRLLIIDDMGLKNFPDRSGEILLKIIMRRHENRSTLMTSNRPVEEWGNSSATSRPQAPSSTGSSTPRRHRHRNTSEKPSYKSGLTAEIKPPSREPRFPAPLLAGKQKSHETEIPLPNPSPKL